MPGIQPSSQLSQEAPGATHATNVGFPRRTITLQTPLSRESQHLVIAAVQAPQSPQARHRSPESRHRVLAAVQAPQTPQSRHRAIAAARTPQSPQSWHRAIAAGQSPFVSQVANPQQSQRGSRLQSDSALLGCQCQRVQPIGVCEASSDIRHLRVVIETELHVFQKTLVAEREAAVKQFRAMMEAGFQSKGERHQDLAKQHYDLEKTVQRLEGGLSKMDSRLSRVALQHMSAKAEHQVFQNTALDLFQSLEESHRTLQHKLRLASILPDDAWPVVAEAEQACRNLDGHSSKDKGGQPATSSASSSHAASPANEKGAFLATDPCLASSPTRSELEKSMRIEVLEVALASMQFHEQEQIRHFRKHTTAGRPWQDCVQHGTMLGS